jgi:hypothetical protein
VAIRVFNSADIVFENMTLDFDNIKGNDVTGILYWDSYGRLAGNLIQNMSVSDAMGGYREITSYFRSPGFTPEARAHSEITGNTFLKTGRLAINAHDYVDLSIESNTFDKGGADFGYAMELGSASTATVIGNIIFGFDTPAASDNSAAAGLFIENAFTSDITGASVLKTIYLENNEIYDCQNGIVMGNQWDGQAGNVDIEFTGLGNLIHDNDQYGIVITDEDREFGSSLNAVFQENEITNNTNGGYVIYGKGDADITVDLTGEVISGNGTGIGHFDTTSLGGGIYSITVYHSSITGNSTFGIENEYSGTIINAANNFWGSYNGPYHAGLNPSGTDNAVSDFVEFIPWCNADYTFCSYPILCGDANDDDDVNVADAVFLISYVFLGGLPPEPLCMGDANGDDEVHVADAVYLIAYVFNGGAPPVPGCCP